MIDINKIELTEVQSGMIAGIIKRNKFDNYDILFKSIELKYTFECFLRSFRLLNIVLISISDEKVKNIIKDIIEHYSNHYIEIFKLYGKINNNFNRIDNEFKNEKYYLNNKKEIDVFLSFIYPFGKDIKSFDPEMEQGIA